MSVVPFHSSQKDQDLLQLAKKTVMSEAKALQELVDSVDHSFLNVVHMLNGIKGRVIVSGMGKSGHIARKIAATFASTGTPAMFVHPAEASHGDLGMITKEDAVIALSNMGETSELRGIIDYSKRFRIPLVVITSHKKSTLAQVADFPLFLPLVPEACPMGLAPTTSTTMMLALGDALAVALLSLRGFSNKDFHTFHPGGNLGRQLAYVKSFMHQKDRVPLVQEGCSMEEAVRVMTLKKLGCVGVVDNDSKLRGVITDGDLRRHLGHDLIDKTVEQIMTKDPIVTKPDCLMAEALATLNQYAITSLFVVSPQNDVLGIIHVHDFLKWGVA